MRALALCSVVMACSVPDVSLEGKQCPCTDGYVCDTLTNRCLQTNGDGGVLDTPAATQCLPTVAGETELYRYAGTFDWANQGGIWSGTATEIHQTDRMGDTYAYRTAVDLNIANYHVISSMRETAQGNGGAPALGIVLRASLAGTPRYRCMWSSDQRALYIQREDSGGSTVIGAAATVPATATLPPVFTMEAGTNGASLSCCIRELPQARVTDVNDTAITMGYPGLETDRKAAAFGSFVVLKRP